MRYVESHDHPSISVNSFNRKKNTKWKTDLRKRLAVAHDFTRQQEPMRDYNARNDRSIELLSLETVVNFRHQSALDELPVYLHRPFQAVRYQWAYTLQVCWRWLHTVSGVSSGRTRVPSNRNLTVDICLPCLSQKASINFLSWVERLILKKTSLLLSVTLMFRCSVGAAPSSAAMAID